MSCLFNLIKANLSFKIRDFFVVFLSYVIITIFFLFKVLNSPGDAAQGDWFIPITNVAAQNDFRSLLYVWSHNGFGGLSIGRYGFPFFPLLNATLAPLGLVGGAEIKVLSVSLVVLAGITAYLLARSLGLGFLSSFLSGLFYMTTAIVFDWLIFGWIFYLIAYDLMPLMLLITKKFVDTKDFRYALINGLILAVATTEPSFILVYPLFGLIFFIFQSKIDAKLILRGLIFTAISLSVWFLTALSFFTSYNNSNVPSFYQGNYFSGMVFENQNLSYMINPIRLWGSTFNFQFETYFPRELIFISFLPVILLALGLLLKSRDKRVLFCSVAYLFVFVPYLITINLNFFVFSVPFGSIFEATSVFLVPASVGLALLVGYSNEGIHSLVNRITKSISKRQVIRFFSFFVIFLLIVSASIPWWTGQISGEPIRGIPIKLNLYEIPLSYKQWTEAVHAEDEYFVLYIPLNPNVQIQSTYFSGEYEGVNEAIFTQINNLPYISAPRTSALIQELLASNNSQFAERWGALSIKYIVVYTNAQNSSITQGAVNHLSEQNGMIRSANFSDVMVFQNNYAKPVVYTDSSNATLKIVYQDPTLYKIVANATYPYKIVLNQVYSDGWIASINGSTVSSELHTNDSNGFNEWQINVTGMTTIELSYGPQATYVVSMAISVAVIIIIVLYLFISMLKRSKKH
jgi:hypothetical protein